jgi:NAD(P)H-nitrite reductase large subunit
VETRAARGIAGVDGAAQAVIASAVHTAQTHSLAVAGGSYAITIPGPGAVTADRSVSPTVRRHLRLTPLTRILRIDDVGCPAGRIDRTLC